ncbi:MAG: hypothetical protein AB8G05_01810 [Oligoflexales bacterium]
MIESFSFFSRNIKTWFFSLLSISSSILAIFILLLSIYFFVEIAEKHDGLVRKKFEDSIVMSIKLYDQLIKEKTNSSINGQLNNSFEKINELLRFSGVTDNSKLLKYAKNNSLKVTFFDLKTGAMIPLSSKKNLKKLE